MLEILNNLMPLKVSDQYMVRPITEVDKYDMYEIYSNVNISKYVAHKNHSSIEETEEFIQILHERINKGANLYLGICEVSSSKLIGIIRFLIKDNPDILTIGYALNERFWGQGIVPLVLDKLVEFVKAEGKYKALRATVRPENLQSRRCLEKLGFEIKGRFIKTDGTEANSSDNERLLFLKDLE